MTPEPEREGRQVHSEETRQEVLRRLAEGESLRAICASEGMPSKSTVLLWADEDAEFRTKYAQARARQIEGLIDGFADLEEQVLSGEVKPDAAKVVLWSRQWRAEKLKPKVYGQKVETTHELGESVSKVVREIIRAA